MNIFELLQTLRSSLEPNDTDQFNNTWVSSNTKFEELHLNAKVEELISKKQENCILQIFMVYRNMIARLVMFIEASRNRHCSLFLRSAKALMQDFVSMDQIKYRRMWDVYIADMTKLQTEDPEVWDSFMQWNFSCQKK